METINAIGRRKAAIARVILSKGSGDFTINKKPSNVFISVDHLKEVVLEPLKVLEMVKEFDVRVNVKGGGIKGQVEAIRLGVSRALVKYNPELKPALKAKDLLSRDSRVVERKKPGFRKARKVSQFSKR